MCGLMVITSNFCVPEKDIAQELHITTKLMLLKKVSWFGINMLNKSLLNKFLFYYIDYTLLLLLNTYLSISSPKCI